MFSLLEAKTHLCSIDPKIWIGNQSNLSTKSSVPLNSWNVDSSIICLSFYSMTKNRNRTWWISLIYCYNADKWAATLKTKILIAILWFILSALNPNHDSVTMIHPLSMEPKPRTLFYSSTSSLSQKVSLKRDQARVYVTARCGCIVLSK